MDPQASLSNLPRQTLTVLAVQSLEASTHFYTNLLGWKPTVQVPVYVQLSGPGGLSLSLYERESYGINTGQVPGLPTPGQAGATELYFTCPDLEARIALARELGARELSPLAQRPWGDEVAYFADPDENVIALSRSKP